MDFFSYVHVLPGSSPAPMTIGIPYENTAIIVESELDAFLLCQEIDRPVFIVALGSTSIKPDSAIAKELVSRLNDCPVVLLALDSDTAGGKAARQWLDEMHNAYRAMTRISLMPICAALTSKPGSVPRWTCAAKKPQRRTTSRTITISISSRNHLGHRHGRSRNRAIFFLIVGRTPASGINTLACHFRSN